MSDLLLYLIYLHRVELFARVLLDLCGCRLLRHIEAQSKQNHRHPNQKQTQKKNYIFLVA